MKSSLLFLLGALCLAPAALTASGTEDPVESAEPVESKTADISPSVTSPRFAGSHPARPELLNEALQSFRKGEIEQGWNQLNTARSWTTSGGQSLVEEATQILRVAHYLQDTRSFASFRSVVSDMVVRMEELEKEAQSEEPPTQSEVYEIIGDFYNRITHEKAKAFLLYNRAAEVKKEKNTQVQEKLKRLEEQHAGKYQFREISGPEESAKDTNP